MMSKATREKASRARYMREYRARKRAEAGHAEYTGVYQWRGREAATLASELLTPEGVRRALDRVVDALHEAEVFLRLAPVDRRLPYWIGSRWRVLCEEVTRAHAAAAKVRSDIAKSETLLAPVVAAPLSAIRARHGQFPTKRRAQARAEAREVAWASTRAALREAKHEA